MDILKEERVNEDCKEEIRKLVKDKLEECFKFVDWNSDESLKILDALLALSIGVHIDELRENRDLGNYLTTVFISAADVLDIIILKLKDKNYCWAASIFQDMIENYVG